VVVDVASHLLLPVLALALTQVAFVAMFARGRLLEVMELEHVRAATAKGLGRAAVFARHVLRNSLAPVVTLFGLYLPGLVSGAVAIEWIFDWQGMGSLLIEAIQRRDFPLVLGVSVLTTLAVLLGSLVADLLHRLLDPRVAA
jgi:peptide/nickel transport system permease protein